MDKQAKKDLFIVLGILVIIFLVWIFTGGPSKTSSKSGPLTIFPIEGPQLIRSQNNSGSAPDRSASPRKDEVSLSATRSIRESDVQKEYLEIRASSKNAGAVNISNWSLENQDGEKVKFGQAALLYALGEINPEQEILLSPGEKALIITGQSPLGTNFKTNKCMGYLAEMQNFYPKLSSECPHPIDNETLPASLDNQCIDYIDKEFELCKTYITLSSAISSACKEFINERINYNGCVRWHKNNSDFYQPEYRIYLKRNSELWNNEHGKIIMYDENNGIIDWISY